MKGVFKIAIIWAFVLAASALATYFMFDDHMWPTVAFISVLLIMAAGASFWIYHTVSYQRDCLTRSNDIE